MKWNEGEIGGGKDVTDLCANVDFMPTILDMCGVLGGEVTNHLYPELEFHGESVLPNIQGEARSDYKDRVIVIDSQRNAYPTKWRKSAVMTSKWRLVNGKELYDIESDKEQRQDVSYNNHDIVQSLRDEYNQWWEIVSKQYDTMIPFYLEKEPVHITCHDLRNEECDTAWNQSQIREGIRFDGYYELDVKEKGQYRLELRRWPKSQSYPIVDGIDGADIEFRKEFVMEKDWVFYQNGKALDISYASIHFQGQEVLIKVGPSDTFVGTTLTLEEGEGRLYCRFLNEKKGMCNSSLLCRYRASEFFRRKC